MTLRRCRFCLARVGCGRERSNKGVELCDFKGFQQRCEPGHQFIAEVGLSQENWRLRRMVSKRKYLALFRRVV